MKIADTIDKELEDYGLKIRYSDSDDREPIDLSIEDNEDNVAWVWGSEPFHDVEWECNHPDECIEYDDDETVGECLLCGSHCDWHYENEVVSEGHDESGNYTCKTSSNRKPHNWYPRKSAGGIIGEIIDYYKRVW